LEQKVGQKVPAARERLCATTDACEIACVRRCTFFFFLFFFLPFPRGAVPTACIRTALLLHEHYVCFICLDVQALA
jgi:hypothetical protein